MIVRFLTLNKLDFSALSTRIKLMISQLVSQLSVQSVNFRQNFSFGQSDIDLISHVFNQHVCQHAINKPVGDVCLPNCLDHTVCKRYFTIIYPSEGEQWRDLPSREATTNDYLSIYHTETKKIVYLCQFTENGSMIKLSTRKKHYSRVWYTLTPNIPQL